MIKIAYHSSTWANFYKGKNYDIKTFLNEIKEIGYDGVELAESLSFIGSHQSLKKHLGMLGLELVSLSCSLHNEIKQRIDFLRHFDTDVAMVCADWIAKSEKKHGVVIQGLRDDLESIAAYAHKRNLNIAIHPHKNTIIETKEDLEDFYSEPTSVKLCIDVAHLAKCGSDPLTVLKEFRTKIIYIHLKDYSYAKKEFLELGEGDINLEAILSHLRNNYNGWLTVELDSTRTSPSVSARISREYLKNQGI